MDKAIYREYFQRVQAGEFDCPFAEACLSLAPSLTEKVTDIDVESAFEYLFRAEFAARMKASYTDSSEDKALWQRAKESLSLAKAVYGLKTSDKVLWVNTECLFDGVLRNGATVSAEISPRPDKSFRIDFHLETSAQNRFFICVPALEVCGLYHSFSVVAKPFSLGEFKYENPSFSFDKVSANSFFRDGKPLLDCGICNFELTRADFDHSQF